MHRIIALALLSSLIAPATAADAVADTQVLIVASYHFSNPGQDLNNVKVDDVLTPKRQAELAAVTDALARFQPTRVAVEWPGDITTERYAKYLAGTLPESRNEVVQLGFRLARSAALKEVNGLDVEGDFPFDDVQKWAKEHGREGVIDGLLAGGKAETDKLTKLQSTETVGGILRYLNEPAEIAHNHSFYPPMLAMGGGAEQPGVKLVSSWYTRNLAICAKLVQTVKPGDRVVLFFGQGHVYLLSQCLREQPRFKLAEALDYLPLSAPTATAAAAATAAAVPLHGIACVDVPKGQPRPEFGCFNVATVRGLRFKTHEVYWHLRTYPTRDAAREAKSEKGVVVETDGKVWLSEFGAKDAAPRGGEPVAVIGPMKLPLSDFYTAVLSYASMHPGDTSRIHTHSGPEAWYMITGDQCLETSKGALRLSAGQSGAVESDIPMLLHVTGTTVRHSFALVIHDHNRPRGTPSDWHPTGACN
ncbi:MAG TPA: DUF5694 domain-containing protein [Steroidobacteraceae bacterium]|nr:DUF5694 domain-containing protein [Steroidobacteraceae bacterium]